MRLTCRAIRLVASPLLATFAAATCGGDAGAPVPENSANILFIGNSLTYTNDLPHTFTDMATGAGAAFISESIARPNMALIDYLGADQSDIAIIDRGTWAYVILQQGPTWPGLCSDTLTLATQMFSDRIRAHGGKPALLMTWPSGGDRQYWDGVHAAYANAAANTGALLIPAGDAWRIAWRNDPSLALYGDDDYHPSPLGTYLTALVIYEQLTGKDARLLPAIAQADGRALDANEATVRVLQRAAHEANGALHAAAPANATAGVRAHGNVRAPQIARITC